MSNRNLFDELVDGMKVWGEMNAGKKTLKSHRVAIRKRVSMTPDELKSVREKLNLSQAVLLIKMVEQNPDTLRTPAAL